MRVVRQTALVRSGYSDSRSYQERVFGGSSAPLATTSTEMPGKIQQLATNRAQIQQLATNRALFVTICWVRCGQQNLSSAHTEARVVGELTAVVMASATERSCRQTRDGGSFIVRHPSGTCVASVARKAPKISVHLMFAFLIHFLPPTATVALQHNPIATAVAAAHACLARAHQKSHTHREHYDFVLFPGGDSEGVPPHWG